MEETFSHISSNSSAIVLVGALSKAIIYKAPIVINSLKYKLCSYSDKHFNRLNFIRKIYKDICRPLEHNTLLSTLDNIGDVYPIFFEIDSNWKRLPKLYLKGFDPDLILANWEKCLNQTSPLITDIQDLIAYICQYQISRRDSSSQNILKSQTKDRVRDLMNGDAPLYYDPINLFCEEFKHWLIKLSFAESEKIIRSIVEQRVKYLVAIYQNNEVFAEENSIIRFQIAVNYIKTTLEEDISKKIDLSISKKSAREYFSKLKSVVNLEIKLLVKYLFYIFRDALEVPENFSYKQLQHPTLEKYTTALKNTSGEFLSYLTNDTIYSESSLVNLSSPIISNYSIADLNPYGYKFLNEEGRAREGHILSLLDEVSQYSFNSIASENAIPTGILLKFRQRVSIENFILLHGYVERLSTFYTICDMVYDITGDTGNLALYNQSALYTLKAINSYKNLLKDIENVIKYTQEITKKLYDNCVYDKANQIQPSINWANHSYKYSQEAYEELANKFKDTLEICKEIKRLIKVVNKAEYAIQFKLKLKTLSELVDHFVKYSNNDSSTDSSESNNISSYKSMTFINNISPLKVSDDIKNNSQKETSDLGNKIMNIRNSMNLNKEEESFLYVIDKQPIVNK